MVQFLCRCMPQTISFSSQESQPTIKPRVPFWISSCSFVSQLWRIKIFLQSYETKFWMESLSLRLSANEILFGVKSALSWCQKKSLILGSLLGGLFVSSFANTQPKATSVEVNLTFTHFVNMTVLFLHQWWLFTIYCINRHAPCKHTVNNNTDLKVLFLEHAVGLHIQYRRWHVCPNNTDLKAVLQLVYIFSTDKFGYPNIPWDHTLLEHAFNTSYLHFLTPQLNPSPLSALISKLVTLTMPTH